MVGVGVLGPASGGGTPPPGGEGEPLPGRDEGGVRPDGGLGCGWVGHGVYLSLSLGSLLGPLFFKQLIAGVAGGWLFSVALRNV